MKESIVQDVTYRIAAESLEPLGYRVVDVRKSEHGASVDFTIVIMTIGREVTIEDCATAHRVLYPRLSLAEGVRAVGLEVSTPGIQRVIRDIHEFNLFTTKRCRIYDSRVSAWVEGFIEACRDGHVVLSSARIDDTKELVESYALPYDHIQKAKLAYAWEDVPQCPTN